MAGSTTDAENDSSSIQVKDEAGESDERQISFSSYQVFIFITNYAAYCMMLYNRQSFTFVLPYMILDHYYSSYEVGMILAAQTFTYTVSRFFCSWATDHYPPRLMLAGGLFFSGIVILSISDQEDWVNIVLLTAANGAAQGIGWPAVSKVIRAWFPPTQFGLWYALLSTASNVILTLGPGIASTMCVSHGWRFALQMPALLAIGSAVVVPYLTVDKPSDVGYEDQLTLSGGVTHGHWSDLAGSNFMLLLATCLCLLFLVKTCCMDWGSVYLIQEKGVLSVLSTSYIVSMEVGGLLGSIFVGSMTDFMVRRQYYVKTGQSPRMIVVQLCVAGSCLFLNLFIFSIEFETSKGFISSIGFCMGFCMYGAISLLGTVTVEIAPIYITGAAHAIVGVASNLGAVVAGSPTNYIATTWNWYTVFIAINIICTFVFLLLVVGKDIKATYIQEEGAGPAKLKNF